MFKQFGWNLRLFLFVCFKGVSALSLWTPNFCLYFFLQYFFVPSLPKYVAQEKIFCEVQLKVHLYCPVVLKYLLYAHKTSTIYSKVQFWYTLCAALPTAILTVHATTWEDNEILWWYFNYISSFNVILSVQCSWTSTVASLVFVHTAVFSYGGQQNENWVFMARFLGTLLCWPWVLPSCHATSCKPVVIVDLSLCACISTMPKC